MKKIKARWNPVYFVLIIFLIFPEILWAFPRPIATLQNFIGEVMIKNAGSWTPPTKGLRLYSGAKIVTRQGSAIVLFDDGATMQVDAFSSIRAMDQIPPSTTASGQKVTLRSIRVMLGRTKYQEQPSSIRKTRIEMPTAVAALRGTGGWFGADDQGDSMGSLYEGAMDTFGEFAEIIPGILNLAQALASPTWQTSVASSSASRDVVLNVQDIQAELNTFINNIDPDIQNSVQDTLGVIQTVLEDIQDKYAKVAQAQQILQASASQGEIATVDTPSEVLEVNTISGQMADMFIAATRESFSADIILILETLKGDSQGLDMARQAKEQNDRALAVADDALQIAGRTAAFVGTQTTQTQREAAVAVIQTASSSLGVAMDTIAISSASVWLAARDDMSGSEQASLLMNEVDQTLEDAGTAIQTADDALTDSGAATTEAQAQSALNLANSAQDAAQTAQITVQESQESSQELMVEPDDQGGVDQEGEPTGIESEDDPLQEQSLEDVENDDTDPASPS